MSIYDGKTVKGYDPAPGKQMPGKYPTTGPAYARYGEPPEGWVYSPADDTYRRSAAYRENLQQYEESAGLREKAPKQPGLLDTVAPVAGTLGAIYLGKTLGTEAIPLAKEALGLGSAATGTATGTAAGGAASPGLLGASGNVISTTSLPSVTATGGGASTAATGGASVSGAVPAPGGLLSGVAPMAGSLGGLGALGGIAAATYLGGKSAVNMLKGKEDKSAQGYLGRGILGIATGGLSEIARPFLGQKSTRDRQSEVSNRLLNEAGDDQVAQQYVSSMRDQFSSAPPDPSKPFAGKYGSFDEYRTAGLEANDLSGVQGNMDAYGTKEWANLTQDQRVKATQALIDNDLYESKDGGVQVKDEAKAKQIIDQALGQQPQVKGAAPTTGIVFDGRPVTKIERTSTRSPGIGLDGKPIRNPGLLGAR